MIIIGEKINGSIPSVAKAIEERDTAFLQELAEKQSAAGADFIDVCASVPEKARGRNPEMDDRDCSGSDGYAAGCGQPVTGDPQRNAAALQQRGAG